MTSEIAVLLADAAAAAYLTKLTIDLIKTRAPSFEGLKVIFLAFTLGFVFNVAWAFYKDGAIDTTTEYAQVFIQSVLSAIGAVGATEAHKAARSE